MAEASARIAEIYARHAASVYRRALALLGNEAEANEVLQDVFVSLLERPQQFAERSQLSTFLYSVTTHACLNRLRNQRNRARLLHAVAPLPAAAAPLDAELLVRVRAALQRLPAPLAEVAVYYFVDELSLQEIAEILGCSRKRVSHLVDQLAAWGREQEAACSAK
jgi:RNA polymerase sigma-70 factor (ECF subfamily)